MNISNANNVRLLLDTGADISLIKLNCLDDDVNFKNNTVAITGINETINTLGTCIGNIKFNDLEISHTFHIVPDQINLRYDGILGLDFIEKHKGVIDLEKKTFTTGNSTIKLIPQEIESCIFIPARSETIARVKVANGNNFEGICDSKEIHPQIIIGSCLTNVINHSGIVPILNITEKDVVIEMPSLVLEPYEGNNYEDTKICMISEVRDTRIAEIQNLINLEHLNFDEKESIVNICEEFSDIFLLKNDTLTATDAVTHKIPLKNDTAPINIRPYRLPQVHKQVVEEHTKKMLKDGIIQPSQSAWNSPLLVVRKKPDANGNPRWRLVVDFRKLNDVTVGDAFPIPNITEILDQLGNSKFFSTLDLSNGFYQIPIDEKSREITAFSANNQHWEFLRLPMGLKGSPASFQRLMFSVLSGLVGLKCFIYLDDIVVYGSNLEDHNRKLSHVFSRLRKFNLKLEPQKCNFLRKEVVYLGHTISEDGIKPDPSKIVAVRDYPIPRNVTDIKAFLGLASYYRKFIEGFSKTAAPLTHLLKKNTEFFWTDSCAQSFAELKAKLISAPILQYPRFNEPFILTTDASGKALGAILSQGKIGKDLPVAYASRILNSAETRYSTTERELLAVVWGVNHFKPYIFGRHFTVITDHKPLVHLKNLRDPGSRLMNMRMKLECYDFEVVYKEGKKNTNADALSRINQDTQMNVNAISANDDVIRTYKEFNKYAKNNVIINNNVREIEEDILKLGSKPQAIFLGLSLDYEISNELIEFLDSEYELTQKLKDCTYTLQDVDILNLNNYKCITAFTRKKFTDQVKDKHVYLVLLKVRELCVENNIQELALVKDGLSEGTSWRLIVCMLRYLFKDTEIKINIFRTKTCYSEQLKKSILQEFHDTPLGGHQGISKTLKRIKRMYKWTGMKRDITEYISKCQNCQMNKTNVQKTNMPMQITTTSTEPFQRCFLDIVGPLNISRNNNKYVLTFIDDLSKFTQAIPLENQEACTIANAFVNEIVLKYCYIPLEILTDQGTNFTSELFKNMCKLFKIKKLQSTAYHPETNGALERSHRTLKEYLRNFINENGDDWDEKLPYYVCNHNSTPHTTTGYEPRELAFGRPSKLPTSITKPPQINYSYDDLISDIQQKFQYIWQDARERTVAAKERSKDYYDQSANPREFTINDRVLLYNESVRRGRSKKLEQQWVGPYTVLEKISPVNYIIKMGNKRYTVHANRLKHFYD